MLHPALAPVSYGYAALVLLSLVLIRWVGEGWWAVTLLLFMPRWILLAPVFGLGALAAILRRPAHLAVQGATALVVAGPLMAFNLPVARLWDHAGPGPRLRLMTYNRGQGPLDASRLIATLDAERIDLVAFQERRSTILDDYFAKGWHTDRTGFIASRYPIVAEYGSFPEDNMPDERYGARFIRARVRMPSGAEFVIGSVHLPTLRPGLNRFLAREPRGLKIHLEWWKGQLARVMKAASEANDTPLLLAGDFNMPSDDSTMAALRRQFHFAFESAGWGYGYTRPSRYPWFRIDHILASPEWTVTKCWVGPDCGSDHLPLVAELVLPAPVAGTGQGAAAR